MQCFHPLTLKERGTVPCGKCVPCLMRHRSDWIVRLQNELDEHSTAVFVTLTYSDEHVPMLGDDRVVSKRDVQLYFKRLRKAGLSFRYFLISEYGSSKSRPHYHFIAYGLSLDDSKTLEAHWHKGFIMVDDITYGRIHYVGGYCLDKSNAPKHSPNFLLASRRPAIGINYLNKSSVVDYHRRTLSTVVRRHGVKSQLPRYYANKVFDDQMKEEIRELNSHKINKDYEKLLMDYPPHQASYMLAHRKKSFENLNMKKLTKSKKL